MDNLKCLYFDQELSQFSTVEIGKREVCTSTGMIYCLFLCNATFVLGQHIESAQENELISGPHFHVPRFYPMSVESEVLASRAVEQHIKCSNEFG